MNLNKKENIVQGECLFIIPASLSVDPSSIMETFRNTSKDRKNTSVLQDLAIENLVNQMWTSIQGREVAICNSFLALMGSSRLSKSNHVPDIQTLIGKNNDVLWNEDELQHADKNDLKQILLRNAFGLEFLTWESVSQCWLSNDSMKRSYNPHHLLGIYPLAAMINHSCTPNAVRIYLGNNMIVHASSSIAAGEEIVWPYLPPTMLVTDRRNTLKKLHGFICKCERCMFEAKYLKLDNIPANLKTSLEQAIKWNESLIDFSADTPDTLDEICLVFKNLECTTLSSPVLNNEMKRYLRLGLVKAFFNMYNALLLISDQNMDMVLASACQLHLSFVAIGANGSTEHLSLLHLCLEIASSRCKQSVDEDSRRDVKFFTEQLKRAHLVRFGPLGGDIESVRKMMQHTKLVLRQKDGILKTTFRFI